MTILLDCFRNTETGGYELNWDKMNDGTNTGAAWNVVNTRKLLVVRGFGDFVGIKSERIKLDRSGPSEDLEESRIARSGLCNMPHVRI